jgi:hypothetical protein
VFYRILGLLCVAGAGLVCALVAVSLALLTVYRRTGRLWWPRLSAFAGGLLYSPLSKLLRLFGKPTQGLDLFLIDAANAVMADRFARAGPARMLVMPQCMRAGDCKAPLHPLEGYQCLRCGHCSLAELSRVAEEHGFRCFIVPGDRYAKRLAKRYAVDAAIGVACPTELSEAMLAGWRMGVAAAGVPLSRDGCFETDVELERVEEAMRRCGSLSSK